MSYLDQAQIDSFQKSGFLSLGKILDESEIDMLRKEYDLLLEGIKGRQLSQVQQITQSSEKSILFRRLLYDARILDPIESVIGPNILLFEDQMLYKPPRSAKSRVFWHQDNAYWLCRPANLVSCWMTLDEVVAENGAMQFIPGSHLKLIPHHHPPGHQVLLEADGVREADSVVVELPAGGALIHHCQVLHSTWPNTIDRPRRALAMHFMTPGTVGRDYTEKVEGVDNTLFQVNYHHPALRLRM